MDSKDAIKLAQKLIDCSFEHTKYINLVAMKRDIINILVDYGKLLINGSNRRGLYGLEAILFPTGDHRDISSNSLHVMLEKELLPSCSECKDVLKGKFATCSKCKDTCCLKSCSVELKRLSKLQLKIPGKNGNTKGSITCCSKCYEKILDSLS